MKQSYKFNDLYIKVVFAAIFAAGAVFAIGNVAYAALAPSLAPCDVVGTPFLTITQNISNDPDSGNHGDWAVDAFTETVKVWVGTDNATYCANANTDNGTFVTNGTVSPEQGVPLTEIIHGTFTGGKNYTLPSSLVLNPDYSTTSTQSVSLPDSSTAGFSWWVNNVFPDVATSSGSSYVNAHFLTYVTANNGTWVNAGTESGGDSGDIIPTPPATNSTTHTTYQDIQSAINAASDGDTITLGTDAITTAQININKAITLDGAGHTIKPTFTKVDSSNNSAIGITASNVTVKNLTIDGTAGTKLHGINVYRATNVVFDTVTISHNGYAGMIVNGSTVTATNLNTDHNVWGAVNVDPGQDVTTPSVFTLNSGTLAESTQIWSNGGNVTATTTVAVNAPGYNMYAVGGKTTPFFIWTNKPLTNVATITNATTTTVYSSIQSAVNAANSGGTVNVAAGTYTEQLTINKNLTVTGADKSTTIIQASSTLTADSFGKKNIVEVNNGANVSLSNLTVAGPGPAGCGSIDTGIAVVGSSTLNISASNVKDVRDNPFSGCQNGEGIRIGTPRGSSDAQMGQGNVNNIVITGYQKNGIVVAGAGSSATIQNSTFSGAGATPTIAQNGIEITGGATATVTNNVISGHDYNGGSGTCAGDGSGLSSADKATFYNNCDDSTGLLLYSHGNGVTATGNTITSNQVGIDVSGSEGATLRNNSITSSALYALHADAADVDAANNWWGSAVSSEIQSLLVGSSTFNPWYINPGKTILSNAISNNTINATAGNLDLVEVSDGEVTLPSGTSAITLGNDTVLNVSSSINTVSNGQVVIGGATTSLSTFAVGTSSVDLTAPQSIGGTGVTVEKAVKLASGSSSIPIIITNTTVPNVSVSIPDGTTILAPSGWTGTIQPPKAGSSAGSVPSGFSIGGTIIEVGAPDAVLLFDKPVALVLAGVTGNVGYKPAGSTTWTQITNTCGGTYDAPANPAFPGECKIDNGTDTKIVTFHFTTFGLLVTTPVSAPSGGGGGGGGGGNSGIPWDWNPNAPQQTTQQATAQPTGQVLGATAFNFTSDLKSGMRGNAVTELQKRLTDEGVYSGPVTGYFGELTLAGVKAYQEKYNISPRSGIVGPLTRAQLNSGLVKGESTVNTAALQAQIANLQAQLVVLLQKLAEVLKSQIK